MNKQEYLEKWSKLDMHEQAMVLNDLSHMFDLDSADGINFLKELVNSMYENS